MSTIANKCYRFSFGGFLSQRLFYLQLDVAVCCHECDADGNLTFGWLVECQLSLLFCLNLSRVKIKLWYLLSAELMWQKKTKTIQSMCFWSCSWVLVKPQTSLIPAARIWSTGYRCHSVQQQWVRNVMAEGRKWPKMCESNNEHCISFRQAWVATSLSVFLPVHVPKTSSLPT